MSNIKYDELNQVLEDLKNGKIKEGTTEIKISENCSVRIRKSQREVLLDCDLESMTRDELLEKVNELECKKSELEDQISELEDMIDEIDCCIDEITQMIVE